MWCCFYVLNGTKSESVISIQKVVPMFQVKVNVKVWYQNKRLFQGDPRWSKGVKLRETIGRRGVHPPIIWGPATQSLHRCKPYNIYTNYEVFSDFSCCWNKLYKSTSSPNALAADPTFIHPLQVNVHPIGQFSFRDCDFSVSTFVHQVGKLHSIIIHRPSKMLKSLLSLSSR